MAAILGLAGRPPILNKGFGMVARLPANIQFRECRWIETSFQWIPPNL
jgi:hypothetical protein